MMIGSASFTADELAAKLKRLLAESSNALDQLEETVAARLNVRTVLKVVGHPEALRCCIVSLIEQSVEGLHYITVLGA